LQQREPCFEAGLSSTGLSFRAARTTRQSRLGSDSTQPVEYDNDVDA
jgi:hypothetical protein